MDKPYTYEFDVHKHVVATECTLRPTDIYQNDFPWLYARNNKYPEDSVDGEKIGKWMLFVKREDVNGVWDQIKMAVSSGDLWHTKVSTKNPSDPNKHVAIIYTKDYTDLPDVLRVHNYLESSGLKLPGGRDIYYKTDQQTRAGVYRGGGQRPWIYSSTTIRQEVLARNNLAQ